MVFFINVLLTVWRKGLFSLSKLWCSFSVSWFVRCPRSSARPFYTGSDPVLCNFPDVSRKPLQDFIIHDSMQAATGIASAILCVVKLTWCSLHKQSAFTLNTHYTPPPVEKKESFQTFFLRSQSLRSYYHLKNYLIYNIA